MQTPEGHPGRETILPSKRELTLATVFFAVLAIFTVAFLRPLGPMEWFGLLTSLAFVAAGCFVLRKGDGPAAQKFERRIADLQRQQASAIERLKPVGFGADGSGLSAGIEQPEPFDFDAVAGEPPPEERHVLETTLAALSDAGALAPGEVDVTSMWRAAHFFDPGKPVDFLAALYSFAALNELGRFEPCRLAFVPVQVEYDAALLADITASALTALGHRVAPDEVLVTLPSDGSQGEATVSFTLDGRVETIACEFLWKNPPSELLGALPSFRNDGDPRELVCADVSYGTLLLAAIRPGGLAELNRHFPVGYDMFGAP